MNTNTILMSYAFAAMAGICFIQGLAVLSKREG